MLWSCHVNRVYPGILIFRLNNEHDDCAQKGVGLSWPTDRVHVEIFRLDAPFQTPSPACLLFSAEVKAIPPEQTVQLREKNSHSVPQPLWQCLDAKSGDSI